MVTIMDHYEGQRIEKIVDDPMEIPRRMMDDWNPQLIDELPEVFTGKCLVIEYTCCIHITLCITPVLRSQVYGHWEG